MAFAFRFFCLLGLAAALMACQTTPAKPVSNPPTQITPAAIKPVPRTKEFSWMSVSRWYQMHSEDVAAAQQKGVEQTIVRLMSIITQQIINCAHFQYLHSFTIFTILNSGKTPVENRRSKQTSK